MRKDIGREARSIVVAVGLVALSGSPAVAELPVTVTLDAHEITQEEAVRSSHSEGSVLMRLAQNAADAFPVPPGSSSATHTGTDQTGFQGASETLMPGHNSGSPGSQQSSSEQLRMHEQGFPGGDEALHQHGSAPSGHMAGEKGRTDEMREHRQRMGGHSEETSGHMGDGDTHHSRMHETGMMGRSDDGMMSRNAPGHTDSMMGPGGGMMGGDAAPEMHHDDGMMGGDSHGDMSHEGMMGGDTQGGTAGGIHGGSDGSGTSGHHDGGMGGGG